jgi:hypothetical protein
VRRHDWGPAQRRRSDVFVALVTSAVALTVSAPARATPTGMAAEAVKRHVVTVKLAGPKGDVAALLDVLRERIGGNARDTSFEVVPAIDRAAIVTPATADSGEQLARIWVDLEDGPRIEDAGSSPRAPVTLYVVDGPWERVLVRPVNREANPEVTWEEIGHIIELALTALRAGERIGVAREQLLPPSPPPTSPPPPPPPQEDAPPRAPAARERRLHFRAGGFYATTAYGSSLELSSGPGAVLELHAPTDLVGRRLEYGVTLTGEYRFPSTVDRGSAVVKFEGASFNAMASASYTLANRHDLMLGVGGGVELVHAQGRSAQLDNVRFVDGNLDPIPTARVLARYGWSTSAVRLFGGFGVDVPFRSPRYLLSRESEPVVLFEPWSVRPFLLFGIQTN